MNGPVNSRFAVGPFVAGAPLLLIGVLFIVGLSSAAGNVIGGVLVAVGVLLLVWSVVMFRKLSRWNDLRKAGWHKLVVLIVIDDAHGEQQKTLLDTPDGKYRIALAHYPLELRDAIEEINEIEYVGELGDNQPILMRPSGGGIEYFGLARELETLRAEGQA